MSGRIERKEQFGGKKNDLLFIPMTILYVFVYSLRTIFFFFISLQMQSRGSEKSSIYSFLFNSAEIIAIVKVTL